ncbi:MAG TPA: S-adenosylmethionine:tRNA ribosyltransferase-isomerase [Trebonia sp.]|jgi:S-adenosylmethionine:tRNA ribosyltransferase-isomerase|nr:S-adenosylmethionine:tRNA ribosyltransferase-isomerase [Trebonia sp.]
MIDFSLPKALEASAPPEARGVARDGVRLMVSRRGTGTVEHRRFSDLPRLLLPGDLVVVNTSRTLPAAVRAGRGLVVHFSTGLPDGSWLVELRIPSGKSSIPNAPGVAGQSIDLPAGARLTLSGRFSSRLWRARLSTAVVPYLLRHGMPIRYGYVGGEWGLGMYQTVFGERFGSAEMPSAARPFSPAVVTALASHGVLIAPVTLHCGVSSLEAGEDPYPEQYDVPPSTARLVQMVRKAGGRVIAAGTTVVRAMETAGTRSGAGWTSLVVTPETGVRVVDGLLTGLHEPQASHLRMLAAFHDGGLLKHCYDEALAQGYLWHEFGDVHLLLP